MGPQQVPVKYYGVKFANRFTLGGYLPPYPRWVGFAGAFLLGSGATAPVPPLHLLARGA